jgi:hypothetical protein
VCGREASSYMWRPTDKGVFFYLANDGAATQDTRSADKVLIYGGCLAVAQVFLIDLDEGWRWPFACDTLVAVKNIRWAGSGQWRVPK